MNQKEHAITVRKEKYYKYDTNKMDYKKTT